jgi:hypothetical protein
MCGRSMSTRSFRRTQPGCRRQAERGSGRACLSPTSSCGCQGVLAAATALQNRLVLVLCAPALYVARCNVPHIQAEAVLDL